MLICTNDLYTMSLEAVIPNPEVWPGDRFSLLNRRFTRQPTYKLTMKPHQSKKKDEIVYDKHMHWIPTEITATTLD